MSTTNQHAARANPALVHSFARAGVMDFFTPATNSDEVHRRFPEVARAFFEMVSFEPLTGVGILSLDGTVLHVNEQGARLLLHEGARSADLIGRTMGDFYPPEIMRERIDVFRRIIAEKHPVLVRTLWNGVQLTSWFRRIPTEPGRPERDVVLALSRLIPGDLRALFPSNLATLIFSEHIRLGPLDCLSNQELRVMALIGAGMTVREAAKALFRAEKTIETHCTAIHRKLGVRDRVEVSRLAQRAGLTPEDADRKRV